jgi:hypothetical protein
VPSEPISLHREENFLNLRLRLCSALAFGALLSLQAVAQVPHIRPFSADLHVTSGRGGDAGHEVNGKIYLTQDHMRLEMEGGPLGGSVFLTNIATQTTDMLMPQQHMYMEFKADQAAMAHRPGMAPSIKPFRDPDNPCATNDGSTCKSLGVEQVNGRSCVHWQITSKSGKVSNSWVDEKLHFPIKTVNEDSSWELTNIEEGEPEGSLFEIPAGYRKMDLGGMMQGMQPPSQ